MENLSVELESILESSYKLRKTLEPVLPKEAIDYILDLIAKDLSHRNYLKIVKEEE